ncbi:MAG: bile acid:sodium symporter [Flavobacteriaceae bacterium]|nr:bile acid:sodium symporter [Flavobacteriaceae bacterium]|tara:strand:- start:6299 stop:7168 length:870 start_codon:yes stop_codon:yes gene_type:complete
MDATIIITQIFLPISLAIIMFGMGLSLVFKDFSRLFTYPKAVLIGLFNQLIFLPLIGFSIILLFDLNSAMAIGIMILSVCPGGPTSNLITQVARGNIGLSVTLTAIASLITVFTIPIILSKAIAYFNGNTDIIIELPVIQTMLQILVITVIPVSIGMVIRKKNEGFALRMERPMRIASTVLFIIIFLLVMIANKENIIQAMKEVGLATLLLNLSTMVLGYITAKFFGITGKSQISITIESGIQNGTLAFVIATTILNNIEMGLPTGAYSIWMFITGGILMWYLGNKKLS